MMATVASLVVDLKANTASFNRAMRDAQSTVKKTLSYTEELQKRESAAAAARVTAKNQTIRQQFDEKTQGNIRSAIGALADYEKAVDSISTKAAAAGGPAGFSLQSIFGKGSALKETLDIVKGGGVIAGLGLLASKFGEIGTALEGMAYAAARGTKEVRRFIDSVPVFGGLNRGAEGIFKYLQYELDEDPFKKNSRIGREVIAERGAAAKSAQESTLARVLPALAEARAVANGTQDIVKLLNDKESELTALYQKGGGFTEDARNAILERYKIQLQAASAKLGAGNLSAASAVPAFTYFGDELSQNILRYAEALKKAEDNFRALNEQADRAERTAVLIGVNDPLTQNILETAQNRRRGLVSAAGGILSQLAAQQNAGPRFAGADVAGSQSEFAGRQRALFASMNIDRKDEKELAKEAVRLARQQLTQQEETNELLKRAVDQAEVVNF